MINKLLKYIYDYYFNRIECIFVALYLYKDFKCIKFGATRMELQKLLFTDLRLVCRQKKKDENFLLATVHAKLFFNTQKPSVNPRRRWRRSNWFPKHFILWVHLGLLLLTINFVCMRSRRVITKTDGIKEIYKCINSGLIKGREREKGGWGKLKH